MKYRIAFRKNPFVTCMCASGKWLKSMQDGREYVGRKLQRFCGLVTSSGSRSSKLLHHLRKNPSIGFLREVEAEQFGQGGGDVFRTAILRVRAGLDAVAHEYDRHMTIVFVW